MCSAILSTCSVKGNELIFQRLKISKADQDKPIAGCQTYAFNGGTAYVSIGLVNQLKVMDTPADKSGLNGKGVSLYFSGGTSNDDSDNRQFQINFVCDPKAGVVGE